MRSLFKTVSLFIVLGSFIITTSCEFARASSHKAPKTLLILGDSLSAGYGITQGKSWTDLLQKRYDDTHAQIRLINASISGDTTANGLNRLSGAIEQYRPDVIVIELGGNDGLRGLPINHIRKNLNALISTALESGAIVSIMAISIPPNYGKKYTRAFKDIFPELATQHSITLLPFLIESIAVQPELMQIDGIHPNEQAQPVIMENMWHSLKPLLQ